ncbi:MAG: hypothetical protein EOO96_02340 [Pedobacter sp.]|nr:MAG: hypothetical protein EOO96_02340 [Pedobacter sp.]
MVLEAARTKDYSDSQMIDLLQVNPSTYYTLKSRLNAKIASLLSKKVENPISVLMDEVARVPANLYGNSKEVSIRALKELEKQLLEYDLSNELIVVYKALAQLHVYSQADFDYYSKLHNKYVAYSLAFSKAENLYYHFIVKIGIYELTRTEENLEEVREIMREMNNISELYQSHRLFVLYNIVHTYFIFTVAEKAETLQAKEIELDNTFQEIKNVFDKYPLDTFYAHMRFVTDFLYFIYYQKTGNFVRARHYYQKTSGSLVQISRQSMLNFHVIQYLQAKAQLAISTNDKELLTSLNDELSASIDIAKDETYLYISFEKYVAIGYFYGENYAATARHLNQLRNNINLKPYWHADTEIKLFQALQYCILGEEDLCLQIINSISRNLREDEKEEFRNIKLFVKICKTGFKVGEAKKKKIRIKTLWEEFKEVNTGHDRILPFLKLNDDIINKMIH